MSFERGDRVSYKRPGSFISKTGTFYSHVKPHPKNRHLPNRATVYFDGRDMPTTVWLSDLTPTGPMPENKE